MSTIAGSVRLDGAPLDRGELDRMVSALAHRGPDGVGMWSDTSVGLAGATASGASLARPERRMIARAAGHVVVAAARIDNRRDLIDLLGGGAEVSDVALILRAYERWGQDSPAKLIGDFAFAIWDERRQQLFCARDHIGVKPFYYHHAPNAFRFASEIKALLTSPRVVYALNPLRVADHLVGLLEDPAITFHRDVYRLPAGHSLTVSRSGTHLHRYWAPDTHREMRLGSDAAYAEAFRECFTEAVRCRLDGGPVASLLSGGLDSSSIVAIARRIRDSEGGAPLDTFTATFPGLPPADLRRIDERMYAEAVVAQGGVTPHYVRGDLLSPLTDLDRALWHLDEAFAAPNLYLHWGLYREAAERGVRVLLDGIDGDTTVSHGLERLPALARSGRLLTLGRELRELSSHHHAGRGHLLRHLVLAPLVPDSVRRAMRWLRADRPGIVAGSLIRPEFARRTGVLDRLEAARKAAEGLRTPREAHHHAMMSGLIPYALELADKAARAFGIEPRYPFFDRRLMELCLAMPADQKLQRGWTRVVMRRAMQGILPEEVRWRSSKASLAPNFGRQLLDKDRNLLDEIIVEQPGAIEEYVDTRALRRVYDRFVAQPASQADALTVYGAAILGHWLQRAKIA